MKYLSFIFNEGDYIYVCVYTLEYIVYIFIYLNIHRYTYNMGFLYIQKNEEQSKIFVKKGVKKMQQ